MQKKTEILFPLFFILILVFSMVIINNVNAQDVDGNHLWIEDIYQNVQEVGSFNNVTYSEGINFTVNNYLWDNFQFITTTRVNTTVIGDGGYVTSYQGVGIQIFDEDLNSVYAGGISPSPPILFDPDPFETIIWMSEIIELDLYKTINYINITLWHNYDATGNTSDFELTESWKFNLLAENYGYTPPEDEMMFKDLYILGFILCIFLCPLSIVGVIKLKKSFFIRTAIFTGIGFIIFFYLLMNINPFG